MSRKLLGVLAFAAAVALSPAATAAGKAHQVTIEGMKFVPERIEAAAGDSITWVNRDPVPHTVTNAANSLESGTIAANGKWKYVVRRKGEIDYVCRFHPGMRGTLAVK
jgi:plastocyanin